MNTHSLSGTGFSREKAEECDIRFCGMTPDAFPAKAGPTKRTHCLSRTGFSREEAGVFAIRCAV